MAKFGISWSQCVIGQLGNVILMLLCWSCCKVGEDVVDHIDHSLVLIRNCMQQPSAHGGVEGDGTSLWPAGRQAGLGPTTARL